MENVYFVNVDVIQCYKQQHNVTDLFEHLKANLERAVAELKGSGFRCALCTEDSIDPEAFKRDDYSPLTRCAKCMKSRA